ncbi:MAG: septal ring lytic transglycosylase RlpA family protein [Micavibrio sp.]
MRKFAFLALLAALSGCASVPKGPDEARQPKDKSCKLLQRGEASWYGNEMAKYWKNGKPVFNPTASGETFYPEKISAAHPALPFGTVVKVVLDKPDADPEGINVRINDRGPYAKGRIIDLSRGAARALGMADTQNVRVYQCGA